MQVTVIKEEGLKREYEVVIPANDIESQIETRLQQEAANLALPGFRKGKVPMKVLKARYGRMVLGEVIETAVNQSNQKLYQDKEVKPAVQPKIEMDQDFDLGKDLKYKMEFEVIPPIKVMDVSGVKLDKQTAEAGDEEVNKSLERIAKQRKATKPVKTKRAAKKGDVLLIDFDGESGGEKHSGMSAEDYSLELGSGSFIPGFEDQLIGAKAGDETTVTVTFPEAYPMKELAGKEANFAVKVKELQETTMPEIDDAFAGTLGFDSLDALKDALKQQAQKEYDNLSRQKVKRQLLDILDEKHKFEVPQTMVDMEFKQISEQMKQNPIGGQKELDKDEEEELKTIAERRVRLGIVLSEIGNQQKVEITNEELQGAVIAEAQKYQGQEAQVFEYFKNNPQALESLKAPIFEEKVVDYLLEQAEVKETKVTPEELAKDDEAEEQAKKSKKKASGSAKGAMGGASSEKKPAAKKS